MYMVCVGVPAAKVMTGGTKECSLSEDFPWKQQQNSKKHATFTCREGVVGWKIIHNPQGHLDTFELSSQVSEDWAAPAQIWQQYFNCFDLAFIKVKYSRRNLVLTGVVQGTDYLFQIDIWCLMVNSGVRNQVKRLVRNHEQLVKCFIQAAGKFTKHH